MSLTALRLMHARYHADLDVGPQLLLFAAPDAEQKQFSQEFQLQSPDEARLRWVAGLYYIHLQERYDPTIFRYGGSYSAMLPRATHTRGNREAAKGKQSGRTQEIQRLIGRSLRAVVDLPKLGERQVIVDCDVIQADGGTRTASISGAWVALRIAIDKLLAAGTLAEDPIRTQVAAVSCGIYEGTPVLDLDYIEDSSAHSDGNFVLTGDGAIVEAQLTAEGATFDEEGLLRLLRLSRVGCDEIFKAQLKAVGK